MKLTLRILFPLALACLAILLLAACSSAAPAGTGTPVPNAPETASTPTLSETVVLTWEGNLWMANETESTCHRLVITQAGTAQYGKCDDPEPKSQAYNTPELARMVQRFAAFQYFTENGKINFRGSGPVAGTVWQRAIMAWAQDTFTVLYTGKACASCNTVVSWSLGPDAAKAGYCAQFLVTNYGYGIVGEKKCGTDDQVQITGQDWLQTEDWEDLDKLIQTHETLYMGDKENSYMVGKGKDKYTDEEVGIVQLIVINSANRLRQQAEIK